jgi:hypothetical protein
MPFTVDCDASGSSCGVILHQGRGSITFFSHAILPHHAKLAAYERKLIGLVKAVCHWWPYLWMWSFVIRTDHYSLKYLLDQCLSTIPQHSWVSKLFGYQFLVEFKPGHQNVTVNALSRQDEEAPVVHTLLVPNFELFDQFCQEALTLQAIITKQEEIATGTAGKARDVVDGIVVHNSWVFMPVTCKLWATVLEHAHGTDHEGI